MNAIRQSNSYVWSVQEPVGQGATGTVFRCRDKVCWCIATIFFLSV